MEKPSEQWIDLFLAVADLCDGPWPDAPDSNVVDAYNKLLFGDGAEIYNEAVDDGAAFLESLEES